MMCAYLICYKREWNICFIKCSTSLIVAEFFGHILGGNVRFAVKTFERRCIQFSYGYWLIACVP